MHYQVLFVIYYNLSLESHYAVQRPKPNIARFPLLQPVDGVDAAVGGVVDAGAVVLDERQVGRDVASRERREASVNLK